MSGISANLSEEEKRELKKKRRDELELARSKQIPQRGLTPQTNPCLMEGQISIKCQTAHGYDACSKQILNYKNCTKFWDKVTKARKKRGIKPYLPDIEDRPAAKEEFAHFIGL